MNYHIIVFGHFTRNGNFIGVNLKKEEIYIDKVQMDSLNLIAVKDIRFPLFTFAKIRTYDRLTGKMGDSNREVINNNGIKETFERLTAYAVYKDFDSSINVFTYTINLNLELIQERESIIKKAGLNGKIATSTDSELNEIENSYLKAENAFREYFEYKISLLKNK